MEKFAVPFCTDQIEDPPWQLYDAERRALKRFDPPRFTSYTDSKEIYMESEPIGVTVSSSGLDRSQARIESTDESDLRAQVELIRGGFGKRPLSSTSEAMSATKAWVSNDQLRQEAVKLFEDIRATAIQSGDEAYHWASISPWHETERLSIRTTDQSLYVGRCGIALLSAGLYHIFGEERYRHFALSAIEPTRRAVRSDWDDPSLTNLGGAIGIGALTYGLGTIADLIDEPRLFDEALQVSNRISEEMIETDETYDIIGGTAGTILGLLGLHDKNASSKLLAKATNCGDHLLENRTTADDGSQVWQTLTDTPPLAGFAHGISGIVYSLIRLSDATGDKRYQEAALKALEYETYAFSEEENNWRDFREESGHQFLDQWCHGRTGIGLARLGSMEYTTDDRLTRGFERAVTGVPLSGISEYDHLCCGNAGRSEFLLEADRRRGRQSGQARRLLGGILNRADEVGHYRTLSESKYHINPTLFHGIAGIGYSMLRVTAPETLPCLLLWE